MFGRRGGVLGGNPLIGGSIIFPCYQWMLVSSVSVSLDFQSLVQCDGVLIWQDLGSTAQPGGSRKAKERAAPRV